jgi:hypothetical protein
MKRISTMKNAVILSVLFFLMGIVPVTGNQAYAAEQGVPLLAQNEYSQESEGGEQDTYSENEGEYDQEQPDQYQENEGENYQEQPEEQYQENEGENYQEQPEEQYQENEGENYQEQPEEQYQENEGENYQEQPEEQYQENDEQNYQEQPEPSEPEPYQGEGDQYYQDQPDQNQNEPELGQDPGALIGQELLEKGEPGSGQDLDGELQGDLPAPGDLTDDAALSAGGSASTLASGQCDKAAGKVIFLLDNVGIHPGTTYIKSRGMAVFSNSGPVTHPVTISPSGFFDSNSFRVIPGTKVYTKASSATQSKHGRIIVNQGKSNETVHDVVICP